MSHTKDKIDELKEAIAEIKRGLLNVVTALDTQNKDTTKAQLMKIYKKLK